MAKLFMMDFPRADIALTPCYKDEELLGELSRASSDQAPLPKIKEAYGHILFPDPPADRPYAVSSIVLSSDGKMAFSDHPAGPVIAKNNFLDPQGALADFWVLNALRAYCDGVVVGARTLQAEAMATSHIFDPELLSQRGQFLKRRGRHPATIVVSFDGTDIPLDHLLFRIDESEGYGVGIATSPRGADYLAKHAPRPVRIVDGEASADFGLFGPGLPLPVFTTGTGSMPDAPALLSRLRALGMERLLIESPSYTAHLMSLGLLDEFFINYSMVFAGGPITPNSGSPFSSAVHPHAQLAMVSMHRGSFMFTRQLLRYGVGMAEDLGKLHY